VSPPLGRADGRRREELGLRARAATADMLAPSRGFPRRRNFQAKRALESASHKRAQRIAHMVFACGMLSVYSNRSCTLHGRGRGQPAEG
jgi:hypothetical protein